MTGCVNKVHLYLGEGEAQHEQSLVSREEKKHSDGYGICIVAEVLIEERRAAPTDFCK
jgi:hypothetical protein